MRAICVSAASSNGPFHNRILSSGLKSDSSAPIGPTSYKRNSVCAENWKVVWVSIPEIDNYVSAVDIPIEAKAGGWVPLAGVDTVTSLTDLGKGVSHQWVIAPRVRAAFRNRASSIQ